MIYAVIDTNVFVSFFVDAIINYVETYGVPYVPKVVTPAQFMEILP